MCIRDRIGAELERRREQAQMPEIAPKADTMLDAAAEVEKAYTDAIQQIDLSLIHI